MQWFDQLLLVTDQVGIFTHVLVRVIVVRLDGLRGRHASLEELHLVHLILVKAHSVTVIGLWVGQGLNRSSHFVARGAGPAQDFARVCLTVAIQIVEGLALSITKHLGKLFKLTLNEHLVEVSLAQ